MKYVPGRLLVRVVAGVDPARVAAAFGAVVIERLPLLGTSVWRVAAATDAALDALAARVALDVRVVFAEPDKLLAAPEANGNPFHFPFDRTARAAGYVDQWAYDQSSARGLLDLPAPDPTLSRIRGAGIVVAVVDTGISRHRDLVSRLLPGANILNPRQLADDLADGRANTAVGHGTMIAGIIARLAPDARLLPVRVLNGDGIGTVTGVAKGLGFALERGAKVINLSLNLGSTSSTLRDYLDLAEARQVVVTVSAGNDGRDFRPFPAGRNGVVTVASIDPDFRKSAFSNYGSHIRVCAPGLAIRSTFPGNQYASWSGTSLATPFVSAQAALLLSARAGMTGDIAIDILRKTARAIDGFNPAYRGRLGKGVIDIAASLRLIL